MNWRKIFSTKEDQKPGVYKIPDGKQIPNNATFTGDKFPSSGNPVNKEQSAWKEGNGLQRSDSKKEISVDKNSPLMDGKTRRERFESLRSRSASRFFQKASNIPDWRYTFLTKKADTSVKTKPDGSLQIDITTPLPGQGVQQGVQQGQVSAPISPEVQPIEPTEPEKKISEKSASERKAFYESNPEFKTWLAAKSKDQEFLQEYHTYMDREHLSNEEPLVFEDWAFGEFNHEKEYNQKNQPQPALSTTTSIEPTTWLIDQKGDYRLEGRECVTHAGIRIMKGNDEIEFQKIAKQGHEWRELIPQGVWQTKLELYASAK
ncbi:MAG: hypothetical protein WC979_07845 [Candidatus Pacearchaeota archaeon]|jgi:hypothetical protein